jgi:hypothetical protein
VVVLQYMQVYTRANRQMVVVTIAWPAALAGLAEELMRSCTKYIAISARLVASINELSYLVYSRHEAVIKAFSRPLK